MNREEMINAYIGLCEESGREDITRREFISSTKISKNKINKIFGSYTNLKKESLEALSDNVSWDGELAFNGDVTYNKDSDNYVMFIKKLNKYVVIPGHQFRDIRRSYSDLLGTPSTITDIARAQKIPRYILTEILKLTGTTHSELPISDEELANKDVEELAEEFLELKRFKIVQEFNKRDWQDTLRDANLYRKLLAREYNPHIDFLKSWNPPEYKSIPYKGKTNGEKTFICSISDIHVGSMADGRYNFFKKGWTPADLSRCVKEYAENIRAEVQDRKSGFKEAYLLMMGDICHGLNGYTDKGTKVDTILYSENQYDLAYNLLVCYINELLTIFPKVNIKSVAGNHSSFGDYVVASTLKAFYSNEPRVNFEITTKRYLTFKIENSLFAMEHGYSALYKARLPKSGTPRENYINGIFLSQPDLLNGIKNKYFLTADQHHFEAKESNFYEHYMFSTIVGGDRHSDNCGYNNRSRQNCLIVDEKGVKEVIHVYFD